MQYVIPEFTHKPPTGYSYETEDFKKGISIIWIWNHACFDYNGGHPVRSVWGFYNSKTKAFHAPINSTTIGSVVSIEETTPYSAMQIKQTPLEAAYV